MNPDRFEFPRWVLLALLLLLQGWRLGLGYSLFDTGSAFVGFGMGCVFSSLAGYLIVWSRSELEPDPVVERGIWVLLGAAVVIMTLAELAHWHGQPLTVVAEPLWLKLHPVALLLSFSLSVMLELGLALLARTFPRPVNTGSPAADHSSQSWLDDEAETAQELERLRAEKEGAEPAPEQLDEELIIVPCRYGCDVFKPKPAPERTAKAAERGHLRTCPNKPKKGEA